MDRKTTSDPLRRRLRRLSRGERAEEARAFVRRFHRELGLGDEVRRRRERVVLAEMRRYGWYEHTPDELAFGARLAWRHSARCIGRLHWQSLEVLDCRGVDEPEGIADCVRKHLAFAWGGGAIKSTISIFPPVKGDSIPGYIENRQVIQYAGRIKPGEPVVGDPLNIEFTRIVSGLGWAEAEGDPRFQVLPLLIRDARQRRSIHPLPAGSIHEVHIEHPAIPAIGELGLKWYAIPCVSSMILTIGGIDYPCAPFNGHYMGTEIASRNLADERRYNLLPQVAMAMGCEPGPGVAFWKDRALLGLNEAVFHSFTDAGIRMTDHHAESERFMDFVERERAEGRQPASDWSWITPPQASPACPVFHMPMHDHHPVPNFYRDRGTDGRLLRPDYNDQERWKHADRWDRLRYRWRRWRRRRDGFRK